MAIPAAIDATSQEISLELPGCRCHRVLNIATGLWRLLNCVFCPIHYDPRGVVGRGPAH